MRKWFMRGLTFWELLLWFVVESKVEAQVF